MVTIVFTSSLVLVDCSSLEAYGGVGGEGGGGGAAGLWDEEEKQQFRGL